MVGGQPSEQRIPSRRGLLVILVNQRVGSTPSYTGQIQEAFLFGEVAPWQRN